MPGESVDDALAAATGLAASGVFSILAYLGEHVTQRSEASAVAETYEQALQAMRAVGLQPQISVKLTQLGLDLDSRFCRENLSRILDQAQPDGIVWVDMEHAPYVDQTLEIHSDVRQRYSNVGVCVQAYLFRTEKDLAALIRQGARVRLVKGAYNEPPEIAFAKKPDVDANFLHLAQQLLSLHARRAGARASFATHDRSLISQITEWATAQHIPNDHIEFQMLYGIQRTEQIRLANVGYRSGVLISYGSYWFPWFMRRLAERPANAFFVARNLFR